MGAAAVVASAAAVALTPIVDTASQTVELPAKGNDVP